MNHHGNDLVDEEEGEVAVFDDGDDSNDPLALLFGEERSVISANSEFIQSTASTFTSFFVSWLHNLSTDNAPNVCL